jgi:hypothetical protein
MRYKVYASQVVYYVAEVEAKDSDEALDIAREQDNWQEIDTDGWSFDNVILENEGE